METLNSDISLSRDKIAQVYLGEWGSEAFQTRTRNRIDWFVEQINGGSVLDIGCSEGILPILLGRKGIDVIGIDINPDALEYAKNLLAQEEPATINHVTFICDDFINGEWTGKTFDIVILGEIIEHFSNPEILIEKAICQLKPGGLLLVTTPFGYYPDPDHKFTFTLTSFLEYFKKHNISPLSLSIVDGYIRFSACNTPAEPKQWENLAQNLLFLTEKGLLDEQKKFFTQLNELVILRQELYNTIKGLKEQKSEIANELMKLSEKYKSLMDDNKTLKDKHETMQIVYQELVSSNNELIKQQDDLQAALKEFEIQNESLQTVYQELVSSNNELKKQHDNLEMEIKTIKNTRSYQVCHEIAIAFKPLRFSSLWLPITLVKIIINWRKLKVHKSD